MAAPSEKLQLSVENQLDHGIEEFAVIVGVARRAEEQHLVDDMERIMIEEALGPGTTIEEMAEISCGPESRAEQQKW